MASTRPPEPVFDLSGGELCLDFANTVSGRGGERPVERLADYLALLAFGRQAGAVEGRLAEALARRARQHPRSAAAVLKTAVGLREALFRIFAAVAAGEPAQPADLAAVNRVLSRALAHLRVAPREEEGGFEWVWEEDAAALDRILWPVARSAAELLTGDELGTVRECASPTCRWLFLDRSRNRSRRWCDMSACGNRAKARRHYRRQRSGG
jgi:predicted RNA-binding Zn ribbon-like protein